MHRSFIALVVVAALVVSTLVACEDSDTSPDNLAAAPDAANADIVGDTLEPDGGPASDTDAPDATPWTTRIEWEPCELLTNPAPGEANLPAQCAWVDVPLDWENPDGDIIQVWVKRIDAPDGAAHDLWMVNGGPGGDTETFERSLPGLIQGWGDVRVYLLEARGAARSTRLTCGTAEAPDTPGGYGIAPSEWDACARELAEFWGEGLRHFNTTSAARDWIALLDATYEPNVGVFLYGVSYGTHWVHRVLQVDSTVADGVILDSIVPFDDPNLSSFDHAHDAEVRAWLADCPDDPHCARYFGADPVAEAEGLFHRFDDGHCDALAQRGYTTRELFRITFGASMGNVQLRPLIAAMVARGARCEEEDISALNSAFDRLLFSGGSDGPRLFSFALAAHVTLSELWGTSPQSASSIIELNDRALGSQGTALNFAMLADDWPVYVPDEYQGTFADTNVPMLMVNGTRDPATPITGAEHVAQHFDGRSQYFFPYPEVGHGALFGSPIRGGRTTCGIVMIRQFMNNPELPPDPTCIDEIETRGYGPSPALANALFGTPTLFYELE